MEHKPKSQSAKAGFFVLLASLLHRLGRGASSLTAAVGCVCVAFGLAATAAPALAATPPRVTALEFEESLESPGHGEKQSPDIYSTSVGMHGILQADGASTSWHFEFIAQEALEKSGSWSSGPGGECSASAEACGIHVVLHHLIPDTAYVVRLVAESSAGAANPAVLEFATHPIAAPEIGEIKVSEIEGLDGEGFELGPTYAAFEAIPEKGPGDEYRAVPAGIEGNGAQSTYSFESAPAEAGGQAPPESSSSWKPFTSGATGNITVAEDFVDPKAKLTGLTPETKYYLRVKAENSVGKTSKIQAFKTRPITPSASAPAPLTAEISSSSASVSAGMVGHGFKTVYRFEYALPEEGHAPGLASPSWTPVLGGEGVVAAVPPSELFASEQGLSLVAATITGLKPATIYYARVHVESEPEPGHHDEAISPSSEPFETFGPPTATTYSVHVLNGDESLDVLGAVKPKSEPVDELQRIAVEGSPTGGTFTLSFEGQTTAPIPFNAQPGTVIEALAALPTIGYGNIGGPAGGKRGVPYTVRFQGAKAGAAQSQITADASGLTPAGTVAVTTLQKGVNFSTHYHFQYVSQKQFAAEPPGHGFDQAASTPEVAGSGEFLSQELPALLAGETYDFHIVATNTTLGNPVVDGAAQTLTVPTPAAVEPQPPCPNQAVRTGLSAHLPDCRAYEQVTPVEKGGTFEPYYWTAGQSTYTVVGADGEHVMLEAPFTKYGSAATAGQGPYLFSRTSSGWRMTAGAPQPEAGVDTYRAQILSPDLTQFALTADFETGPGESSQSPDLELKAGPAGGPYTIVAKVPRGDVQEGDGWAASSEDFSKLILQVHDPRLVAGHRTGTVGGADLYEFSGGQLRQVNVMGGSPEATIGTCGAVMADGSAESLEQPSPLSASAHAVSADGSHVFFEAVPGSNCAEARHLYMRVDGGGEGAATVDIGAYKFAAANSQGTELLLEKRAGENPGLYLYNTESATAEFLSSTGPLIGAQSLAISEDFNVIYGESGNFLYRYDISTHTLSPLIPGNLIDYVSPDGRYAYFGTGGVTRYDGAENVIECIECASPFDPSPKEGIENNGGANSYGVQGVTFDSRDGMPRRVYDSANGAFAFFATDSALVPEDVNGEPDSEEQSVARSEVRATDVYEWREDGVDGCAHLQGCTALITPGTDGQMVALIGTDASGRDVFFTTRSQLLPSDKDTASDIYDARIDGGFPEASSPVECEGDACSTPASPPNDATPSSFTFMGAGNTLQPPSTKSEGGPSKGKRATKGKKATGKHRAKKRHRGRKASKRRGKAKKSSAGRSK